MTAQRSKQLKTLRKWVLIHAIFFLIFNIFFYAAISAMLSTAIVLLAITHPENDQDIEYIKGPIINIIMGKNK